MSESATGHAVRSFRAFFAGRMPSGSELARAVVAMEGDSDGQRSPAFPVGPSVLSGIPLRLP